MVPAIEGLITNGRKLPMAPRRLPNGTVLAEMFAGVVVMDGKPVRAGAIVLTDANGRRHYDLTNDVKSAAERPDEAGGASAKASVPVLDASPGSELNLLLLDDTSKVSSDAFDGPALQARLESYGIARKVALRVVDTLGGAAGSYRESLIKVATDTAQDGTFTLDHEVIHALRDMGMFNKSEWAILGAKARRDPGLMRSIRQRYPKLSAESQIEEAVADMFARFQRGDYKAEGTIGRVFKALRQALEAISNAFRGQGLRSSESVLRDVAEGQTGRRDGDASPRGTETKSNPEQDRFAAEWLNEMASIDTMFQNPPAQSGTVEGVFTEVAPDIVYEGVEELVSDQYGAERKHLLRTPRGQDIHVFERGDELWIDVSDLLEGGRGSGVYQAMGDLAYNTRRQFIGDPAGLSDIALRRRTDAMLSSALKHGTTDHLEPHPRQVEGDATLGVPPLRWQEGDTLGNIQRMIAVSLASLRHDVPDFANDKYHFDFTSGTFRDSSGRVLTDIDFRRAADTARRGGSTSAGRATLKRGVLLDSLSRAQSSKQPGLLELVYSQRGQLLLVAGLKNPFPP